MAENTRRSVVIARTRLGHYRVDNSRGGSITIGSGDDADFTPVELLLAAIGGCTASDVDHITSKRAEPTEFTVSVAGDKVRDENGNHMTNLVVDFQVAFPAGEAGDPARQMLPRAVSRSHDRLCTVSRTVQVGAAIDNRVNGEPPNDELAG